jgi:hypothetical protein
MTGQGWCVIREYTEVTDRKEQTSDFGILRKKLRPIKPQKMSLNALNTKSQLILNSVSMCHANVVIPHCSKNF